VPATFLFSHLQDAQAFYKGLVRSRMTDTVFKFGVNRLSQNFETALQSRQRSTSGTSIPIPILANYLVVELFALLKWWLDRDMPYPPERMDEIFHELVNPTCRTALARD
jgi:Transcriptional regulator C-terminal region